MNIQECDILNSIYETPYINQRELSVRTGHSLGIINRSLKQLCSAGYLDESMRLTSDALQLLQDARPKKAVLLAAGFGMRMVPINRETPKGLLEVRGETLIKRLIRQLHEVGVTDISVVVGFMKEQFEYLVDAYGVKLIVNPDYAAKNNLHSLYLARHHLRDAYIVPCDLWFRLNPFRRCELRSWYMVTPEESPRSTVKITRKQTLAPVPRNGSTMVGVAYFCADDALRLQEQISAMEGDPLCSSVFWEAVFARKDMVLPDARIVPPEDAVEINTDEQLRELDSSSNHLHSQVMDIIAQTLQVDLNEIVDIAVLKKGMTNRSFLFRCHDTRYIMRIPGEGTEQLINRREEALVYRALQGSGICDDVLYLNPENGYKLTVFLDNARACDPHNQDDLAACMKKLRAFHAKELQVDHTFDLFEKIRFYESLWNGQPSAYRDHEKTTENIFSLRPYIEAHAGKQVLTHIDAVPDNFLFSGDDLRLIDWEYAGMQDPHVDIAMFCIYSMYNREESDRLIDLYFPEGCPRETRIKIYCYIAVCGLLWSNWCEYKRSLGVEFGEYSLRQYRYAKEYYRIVCDERNKAGDTLS